MILYSKIIMTTRKWRPSWKKMSAILTFYKKETILFLILCSLAITFVFHCHILNQFKQKHTLLQHSMIEMTLFYALIGGHIEILRPF